MYRSRRSVLELNDTPAPAQVNPQPAAARGQNNFQDNQVNPLQMNGPAEPLLNAGYPGDTNGAGAPQLIYPIVVTRLNPEVQTKSENIEGNSLY